MWLVNVLKTPEVIRDADGEPYLILYFVYRPKRKTTGRVYLHHIIRSDDFRALHDHPWKFTSFMLWGHYYEYVDDRQVPKNDIGKHFVSGLCVTNGAGGGTTTTGVESAKKGWKWRYDYNQR